MAKNPDPVRPAGPPPPAASSRPRPTAAARPPPKPVAGGKMWSPSAKEAGPTATAGAASATPKAGGENLRMMPLSDDDGAPEGSASTSFFSLPAPKRPAGGDPNEPIQSLRRHDPIAAAGGSPAPMAMAPPPGAYAPMGMAPMTPMQHSPMVPLGIQGPIANGPMYGNSPHSAQLPPDLQQDVQRAQSYRVFAIVAGLMFMVLAAVIATVVLTIGIVLYGNQEGPKEPVVAIVAPPPPPPPAVDTGIERDPLPPPPTKPNPRPTTGGGTTTPKPVTPKPVATPPPAVDPAQVTITLTPGSPPFTSIEVKCPSGFRERGGFSGVTASVPAVPREDCDLYFKGGPPSKTKISGGQSKTCSFQGVAANCQ